MTQNLLIQLSYSRGSFNSIFYIGLIVLCPLLGSPLMAQEQGKKSQKENKKNADALPEDTIPQDVINTRLNRAFLRIASSPNTGTNPTNSVSFDPVSAKVKINSFVPLTNFDTKSQQVFGTIRASGDLSNSNSLALFEEGKLGTGTTLEAKLGWVIGKGSLSSFSGSQSVAYYRKQMMLSKIEKEEREINSAFTSDEITKSLKRARADLETANNLKNQLANFVSTIENQVLAQPTPSTVDEVKKMVELIANQTKLKEELKAVSLARGKLQNLVDSLEYLSKSSSIDQFKTFAQDKIEERKRKVNLNAYSILDTTSLSLKWISLGGSFDRRKYYLYNQALPLVMPVEKLYAESWSIGLEFNYYRESYLSGKKWYVNAGAAYRESNDLLDLKTQTINQEIFHKNDSVANVVKNTYVAIDSPIKNFKSVFLYSNTYFFIGKKIPFGFHFFPEIELRTRTGNSVSAGLGFVICIPNSRTDGSLINIEPFFNFKDIFNGLDADSKFGERINIGITATVPINLFPQTKK